MKTFFGLLLAALLMAAYVMGTGMYNMAATEKHWAITEKIIEWARVNSIAARSENLAIMTMDSADSLATGAAHYDTMCTSCHLAPGMEATELSQGLYPQAPVFHRREPLTGQEDIQAQTRAYFWVIKNGIKMTAMPAWGLTHDDETIWAMAFFTQRLSGMSPDQYNELVHISDEHGHDDHEH